MRFAEITWENLQEVLSIKPAKEQEKYLPTVATFLSQSYVNLQAGYEDYSKAIYKDDELVGYVKLVYVPKKEAPYDLSIDSYMVDALLIKEENQGHGYGKEVLKMLISFVDESVVHKGISMSLTCHKENQQAIKMFMDFGFEKVREYGEKRNLDIYLKKS